MLAVVLALSVAAVRPPAVGAPIVLKVAFDNNHSKRGAAFATRDLLRGQCVLVTARHVVSDEAVLTYIQASTNPSKGAIDIGRPTVLTWPGHDLAVLTGPDLEQFCEPPKAFRLSKTCQPIQHHAELDIVALFVAGESHAQTWFADYTSPRAIKNQAAFLGAAAPDFGSLSDDAEVMVYGAATEPGTSGAAIVDVTTGEVVGVHFAETLPSPEYKRVSYAMRFDCFTRDKLGKPVEVASNDIFAPSALAESAALLPDSIAAEFHRGDVWLDLGHFELNPRQGRSTSWTLGLVLERNLEHIDREGGGIGTAIALGPAFRRASEEVSGTREVLETSFEVPIYLSAEAHKYVGEYSLELDLAGVAEPGVRTTDGVVPQLGYGAAIGLKLVGFNNGALVVRAAYVWRRTKFADRSLKDYQPELGLVIEAGPFLRELAPR